VLVIRRRQKKIVKESIASGSTLEAKEMLVLNHIIKSNTAIPKVSIIEGLEIPPNTFKAIISILRSKRLIVETPTHIRVTKFGRQYYDTFIKNDEGY